LESDLALAIPAVIELPLVLICPFLVDVVRGMTGTRREVDEEWHIGRNRFLLADPRNCALGHRFGEMPFRIVVRRLDGRGVLVEWRVPLARLSSLESVPIAEAFSDRPPIERTGSAELVIRGVVPFSERGGAVLISLQNLSDACRFPRPRSIVAGESGGHLGDDAGV